MQKIHRGFFIGLFAFFLIGGIAGSGGDAYAQCSGSCTDQNGSSPCASTDIDPAQDCSSAGPSYVCCVPAAATGSGTISFANPLAHDTVDGVLTSLLGALQGIIVVLAVVFIVVGGILYITSAGNDKQTTMAKSAIFAAMIGLAVGVAAPSFLKEIYTILGGTDETGETDDALSLAEILFNTLEFLLSVVGVLAVIMLVFGGMRYLLAAGDESAIDSGKKIVTYAIIGIIVSLSALLIVRQIATFFG